MAEKLKKSVLKPMGRYFDLSGSSGPWIEAREKLGSMTTSPFSTIKPNLSPWLHIK